MRGTKAQLYSAIQITCKLCQKQSYNARIVHTPRTWCARSAQRRLSLNVQPVENKKSRKIRAASSSPTVRCPPLPPGEEGREGGGALGGGALGTVGVQPAFGRRASSLTLPRAVVPATLVPLAPGSRSKARGLYSAEIVPAAIRIFLGPLGRDCGEAALETSCQAPEMAACPISY